MSPAGPVEVDSDGLDDTLRLLLRDLAKESARPTIARARAGQREARPGGSVTAINSGLTSRILVGLSMMYGAIVAVVVVSGGNVGLVAAVGGIAVGACWALYAALSAKRPEGS